MLQKRVPIKKTSTKTVEKRKSETVRRQALNRRRDVERRRKMTQINAALNRLSKKFRRVNIPLPISEIESQNNQRTSERV